MIPAPRRAVTRFFIPMIDVLILLVCIFLLMPFVSAPTTDPAPDAADDVEALKRELATAQRAIARMGREQAAPFERLRVTVLDIDPESGRLMAFDAATGRREVATEADAAKLIAAEQAAAGAKEIGFLLRYPQELTGFPLREQVESYRRWFRGVPYAFDNPWAGK
jgi:hypothetical protein